MAKLTLFLISHLIAISTAITIPLSPLPAIPLNTSTSASSPADLFHRSCPEEFASSLPYTPEILFSSYPSSLNGTVYVSSGSFVRGAIEAWAKHQHLVLRPDEVWFEILAQLNFYMSRNAERVRHLFVEHDGRKEIVVAGRSWDEMLESFGEEIQHRVKTPWLLDWATPSFTTSTTNDTLTATVLLMGMLQQYFTYEALMICGLPRITLLGTRADWASLLLKLDHLSAFGPEPAAYAENLRPILARFVRTWDEPESEEVKAFWRQIVRADKAYGCGEGAWEWDVSGWITGFLQWRKEGELRVLKDDYIDIYDDDEEEEDDTPYEGSLTLDNITYTPEPLASIPIAYAKVPLLLQTSPDTKTQAYLLAGNIGIKRVEDKEDGGQVTAQPLSGWCVYAPVWWNYTTGPWFGNGGEVFGMAGWVGGCEKEEGGGEL